MNLNKILLKGTIIFLLSVFPISLFMIKMDPYQFFNKDDLYLSQERFQIPGIARNQTYNTAIIGTSMIENFIDSEVSKQLSTDAIKLPINASYATEQGMVIDMAIKHNNVETIIWNIDYRCLDIEYGETYEKKIEFPTYMYDEKSYNDWKYIVNHSNLFLSIRKLIYETNNVDKYNEFKTDLNTLNTWYKWQDFSKKNILDDYKQLKSGIRDFDDKLNFNDISEIEKVIDKELIERFDKYKHINFVLTFPPKSILWFRLLDEKELLNNKEHAQLYLLKRIEKLENVTVYNFQNVYQITENPDIYHDVSHYNKSGNDFMLDSIKDKTHQTNSVKYEKQMKDLRNHIYSDKVENMLK